MSSIVNQFSIIRTLTRMLCRRQISVFVLLILFNSTFSCKNARQNNPKPVVAFDPRPAPSTTTTTTTTSTITTTTTTTSTTSAPDVPSVLEVVKKDTKLVIDWSNGVKMWIELEDVADCQLVGTLPWDSDGSVSVTGCEEDDITVSIQSKTYGNWTVRATTQSNLTDNA